MDFGTLLGLLVAGTAILLGLLLEGGKIGQIAQPTAALIVCGGTLGAVLVQFSLRTVVKAFRSVLFIFIAPKADPLQTIQTILEIANKARREGIVALDRDLESITDPFLKKALMLAVDGSEPREVRAIMELEMEQQEDYDEAVPKVFESAGGFSPTIGIIGAVLGLIQVMQHLDDINEVGRGIAVAFVATVYGVGAANLILLPAAGKLRTRIQDELRTREMVLEGVISILEGMNPRMIETKLLSFVGDIRRAQKDAEEGDEKKAA
jgi:chemotaxis protein MotA